MRFDFIEKIYVQFVTWAFLLERMYLSLMQLTGVIDFEFSKWHCEDLTSYFELIILLQSKHLNQLRLTPLGTIFYLSELPNPSPSHYASSFAKMYKKWGLFHFLQEIRRRITKSIFTVLNHSYLYQYTVKRVLQLETDYTLC